MGSGNAPHSARRGLVPAEIQSTGSRLKRAAVSATLRRNNLAREHPLVGNPRGLATPVDAQGRSAPEGTSAGEARSAGVPKRSDPQARDRSGAPRPLGNPMTERAPRSAVAGWPTLCRMDLSVRARRGHATGSADADKPALPIGPAPTIGTRRRGHDGARAISAIPQARLCPEAEAGCRVGNARDRRGGAQVERRSTALSCHCAGSDHPARTAPERCPSQAAVTGGRPFACKIGDVRGNRRCAPLDGTIRHPWTL